MKINDNIYNLLKIAVILLTIQLFISCSTRKDVKQDFADADTVEQNEKSPLSRIEEILPGYNYNEIIENYKNILPAGFSITRYKYFVIFSDLDDSQTYALIENDVKNTSIAMTGNYVEKVPDIVTPIILFKEYNNYKNFALKNYDITEHDLSPYGFYKISINVIVVRYVSWKGSILHEITHRFLRSDFPDIPSWFDEGFAALNEKSTFNNGNLIGEFSWRIISLRRAFENNTYTGLRILMESNDEELYSQRSSFYYAQSRYLLMMIQQKGLLKEYYTLFRETFSKDETGITQLEKVTKKSLVENDEELAEYLKSFK